VLALAATTGVVLAPGAGARGGAVGGGAAGGGGAMPTGPCASIVVTNTGQTVRDFKQPDIKFNLENCGTTALDVTITQLEASSAWYPVCAAALPAPVTTSLAAKAKVSLTSPTFRGPCGFADNKSLTVIWSTFAFQGHNVYLTVTDNSTGAVLATSSWFSWQDCLLCGGV
jgi:hypothetical protein